MELRKLGNTQLNVSPICLGGNVFGWTIDEARSFDVLDAFVAGGGNFVDTADVYAYWLHEQGGESETVIGNWMKSRRNRERVVVATKVGSKMGEHKEGLSERWILQAVEDSLRRLQTDYIDLYQSHIDDPYTPLEETLGAFDKLVSQGKVRAIGCSNYSGSRLRDALQTSALQRLARYECLQPRYNAVDRDFEHDQLPVCLEFGVGVIPYFALGAGFLTGKYRRGQPLPETARAKGVQNRWMHDKGFDVLDKVEAAAKAHNATMAQVAVAWLMNRPGVIAPIASATSVAHVKEMLGAADLKLEADALG